MRSMVAITTTLCFLLLLPPRTESFSFSSRFLNLLRPASTTHLADVLELYDVIQDPAFLASSPRSDEWMAAFGSIVTDVEVTSQGVAQGQGLIARRDFQVGEVVALYPIHAIGFSDGKSPPRIHDRTSRIYSVPGGSGDGIVGTSDLLYFENESHIFGEEKEKHEGNCEQKENQNQSDAEEEAKDKFIFTMTDPSGKYVFDVNPERYTRRRIGQEHQRPLIGNSSQSIINDNLCVAHFVNDASFADFSPVVNAAKIWRRRRGGSGDSLREGEELDDTAARLAMEYLAASTGTTAAVVEEAGAVKNCDDAERSGFNVVMCGFGPPPLMSYVTTRPVLRGEELLASYGLGYWLGKAFPEDDDAVLDAALAALDARPEVRQAQDRADDAVEVALAAGDQAVRTKYTAHTRLLEDTFVELRRDRRRRTAAKSRSRPWQFLTGRRR